ncbi:MAG: 4Fe-4S binding protein [Candidatus Adiutrix sp.]|jgi:anaerobic dimethyl sulfoxide reductase subunit B (iron-sulfur subunit)|nr:4Fe-4S binding protein [Candidatus Adiutrix sp.]
MKYIIALDPERCSACSACSVACMDQNDVDIQAGERPFRHAFEWETKKPGADDREYFYFSVSCRHCEDAPCLLACPTGCISRNLTTGMIIGDTDSCIGCRSCSLACPFGAPGFGLDGKMVKCDGCAVRLENGLMPACVRACAFEALKCLTREQYDQMLLTKSKESMVKALGALNGI